MSEADKVDAVDFVDWVLTRRDAVAYYEPHPPRTNPTYKVGVPCSHTLSFTRTIRKKVKYRNTPGTKNKGSSKKISTKNLEKQGDKVNRV